MVEQKDLYKPKEVAEIASLFKEYFDINRRHSEPQRTHLLGEVSKQIPDNVKEFINHRLEYILNSSAIEH